MPDLKTTKASEQNPSWPNLDTGAYAFVDTLVWALAVVIIVWLLRGRLRLITSVLVDRLRGGAPIEIASFKIGALPPAPTGTAPGPQVRGILEIRDDTGECDEARRSFKTELRNLFLVHKITPSSDPEELYDILLFVVPSLKYGSLSGVLAVEYYFGKYWGKKVFRSIDRANGFLIATSAYAPFTATARVCFSDGTCVFLHRYVDFEMGQLPPGVRRGTEV